MNFISKESIDEVESKIDIVHVVGEYVPLTQRGSTWFGCCPFHHEKTPSFSVDGDRKFYYCFGCHAAGNVFKFLQEMEKVSFAESVEILAKKAGVQLNYVNSGDDYHKQDENVKKKEEYINLYTRVATTFHYFLMETESGKFALDYITSRGLTKETLEKFKLGYSPADRKWLHSFLLKKNFSEDFLNNSGLFSKKYPEIAFFSDRLMFPIFDKNGNVVAMGGRFLRGDSSKSPKYLNSGDLIQYKKGSVLYAFNFAKKAMREFKRVIFCEGYMDCIAYHQCGIEYAVAPLGTALTEEHIRMVKSFAETIYLSFDSDSAGQNATKKAILMCRKQGKTVKVIRLKGGKDPAEIMLKFGTDVLTDAVESAILDNDFLLTKLLEVYPKTTPENKAKASLAFFTYIDALQSDIQKNACLEQLGQMYGIEMEALKKDYTNRKDLSKNIKNNTVHSDTVEIPAVKMSAELRAVMTVITDDKKLFAQMKEAVSAENLEDNNAKTLFLIMEECYNSDNYSVSSILNRCENDELKQLIYDSINEFSNHVEQSAKDSIQLLKRNVLERKRAKTQELIHAFESSSLNGDRKYLKELLAQKMEVDRQIALLKD